MRKPDFFMVGAPKCGTTAMFNYLVQHPQIFMPPKEIHFFGSDLYTTPPIPEDQYVELFAHAGDQQRVGEASVWYLYSSLAAAEIKRFNPEARIIIMLRNPVDMLYSLHSQLLYIGLEETEDFEKALASERGLRPWRNPGAKDVIFYHAAAQYAEQVKRYFDVFGRERVKVIVFDDFKAEQLGVFQETCGFLDVDSEFRPEIAVVNPNKKIRSQSLREFVEKPPLAVKELGKLLTPTAPRQQLLKHLRRLNTKFEARPPLPQELRSRLQSYFAPEVDQLGDLLGRDLTHWLK